MSNSQSQSLDSPRPIYRYLPSPEKQLIKRNVPTAVMPLLGDFVVFSVDPVASVAHLDKLARQAARKIRTRRHIGLVIMMEGLAMDDDPVNAFSFAFLRKGLPRTAAPHSYPDLCIPVLPNVFHPSGLEPLRPIHPPPWDGCYINATDELNFRTLRVKTTCRDYTPILPLEPEDLWRVNTTVDDCAGVTEERLRRIQQGELEAIAAVPLPESPLSAKHMPLPASPTADIRDDQKYGDGASVHSSASSNEQRVDELSPDDISMIGSVDSNSPEESAVCSPDDVDAGFLREFEGFLNNAGSVDDPVVDIWYDLDMVKEVIDISLFLEECAQIRRIIDDAEERLGIRAAREAAVAERKELRARAAEEARVHASTARPGLLRRLSGILRGALHTVVCHSSMAHGDEI